MKGNEGKWQGNTRQMQGNEKNKAKNKVFVLRSFVVPLWLEGMPEEH